eukprot:TRINITY_DN1060_c4_g1_i1.p1 TRINITY_DN1060_c4_g1~~TRINITY_DN1060_c4_g1_i1.p1  ORF type:complete len:538 (+),score=76.73 TRINITY_DN1060_c4_g1_i1:106-1614(+)
MGCPTVNSSAPKYLLVVVGLAVLILLCTLGMSVAGCSGLRDDALELKMQRLLEDAGARVASLERLTDSMRRNTPAATRRTQGVAVPMSDDVCASDVAWVGGCSGNGRSERWPQEHDAGKCACACLSRPWCEVFGIAHDSGCTLYDSKCSKSNASGSVVHRPILRRTSGGEERFKCLLMFAPVDFLRKGSISERTQRRAMLEISKSIASQCDEASVYMSVNTTKRFDMERLRTDLQAVGVGLELLSLSHWREEAANLWEKEYTMWVRAMRSDLHRFDYFVKVEADTMLVGNNFRRLLRENRGRMDPDEPNFMGPIAWHRPPVPVILSNYVLTRGALRKLGPVLERLITAPRRGGRNVRVPSPGHRVPAQAHVSEWFGCDDLETQEGDFEISRCLATLGVAPSAQNWDSSGRELFFSCTMDQRKTLPPDRTFWFWTGRPFRYSGIEDCCAKYPVMSHLHKDSCRLLGMYQQTLSADPDEVDGDFMRATEKGDNIPEWCRAGATL